jgi:hypothetical protein
MCHGLQITEVVKGNDFELIRVEVPDRLEDLPPDAAKSINTHFDSHVKLSL